MVLVSLGKDSAARRVKKIVPPSKNGFSLEEIARIAARNGTPMRGFRVKSSPVIGARAAQLGHLPLPLILHYDMARYGMVSSQKGQGGFGLSRGIAAQAFTVSAKGSADVVPPCPACPPGTTKGGKKLSQNATAKAFQVRSVGHFLVVRAVDVVNRSVTLDDPLSHSIYKLSFAQLEREWSGAGLMLDRKAPRQKVPGLLQTSSQVRLSAAGNEAIEILGRAAMTRIRGGCCCPWKFGPNGPPDPGPNDPPPPVDPPCPKGSPKVQVSPISMNTYISDIPVWYDTPLGPDVEPLLSYNSQDTTYFSSFGNKWRLNYEASILENPGGLVILNEGTGKFTPYRQTATGGYAAPSGVFSSLTKTGNNHFEITQPTGEKTIFDQPRDVNNVIINVPLVQLQEVRDRFGNGLQVRYASFTQTVNGTSVTSVRLARLIDAQGKVTVFQYNAGNRCTAIVITNTTNGDVNSSTARRATFGYDAGGNLTNVEDMGGNPFSYVYDSEEIVTTLGTEQGNWTLAHRYEGHNPFTSVAMYNNETTVTDPQGGTQSYGMYLQIGGPFSGDVKFVYSDANGNQTMNGYGAPIDGVLHLVNEVGPGYTTLNSHTYDPAIARINSSTDENGNTSTVTYNWQGRPTSTTSPLGQTTRLYYDSNGLDLTQVKNSRGNTVMSATYTTFHQPDSVTTYPTASLTPAYTTSYTYTAWGTPLTVTNPSNETTTYNYDATTKRLTSVAVSSPTLSSTTVATFSYDALGRVLTSIDAYGLGRTFEYNDLDKPVKVTYPDGSKEITDYVCCAIPGVTIDRSGRKTYRDYDELKRLRRVQDADGNTVQTDYDKNGNMTSLIDGNGSVTRWNYDSKNRVVRKTYADGSREGFAYDGMGRLIRSYDAIGQVTKYEYDADSHLTKIDYPRPGAIWDATFAYDDLGRLSQMGDVNGATTWSYDNLGRATQEDGPWTDDALNYTYDVQGRRKTLSVNGAQNTTYNYDSLGRLGSLVAPAGTWNWSYVGSSGLPSLMTAPNTTRTSYSYDTLERLRSVQNLKSDAVSVLSKFAYDFDDTLKKDARWKLTRQSRDTAQTVGASQILTFGNSATDQLTGETSNETNPLTKLTRTYDAMGNWQTSSDQGRDTATTGIRNISQSFTNNRLNQLTSIATTYTDATTGTNTLSYDVRGNIAKSDDTKLPLRTQYYFDDANRLYQIMTINKSTGSSAGLTSFYYDGLGRRKRMIEQVWDVPSSTWKNTRDVFLATDGMDVVRERDEVWGTPGNNATKTTSVYALTRVGNIGGLLARTKQVSGQADRHSFYSYDGSGNVTTITDASQTVQCAYAYSGFGLEKAQEASGWDQPYRYSTKWQHASGLVDYGYRFYSPAWGRWINRDPLEEAGGANLYGFVGNSPTNGVDPYGLTLASNAKFLGEWVIGGGAGARFYGPGSLESTEMAVSPGINRLRNEFYYVGCKSIVRRGSYGTFRGYVETVWDPATADWANTSFQVGGFGGASVINNGNGTMTFTIPNVAGARSLFLHIAPNNPFGPSGPMRSISQTFTWTENLNPCNCGIPRPSPNLMDKFINAFERIIP